MVGCIGAGAERYVELASGNAWAVKRAATLFLVKRDPDLNEKQTADMLASITAEVYIQIRYVAKIVLSRNFWKTVSGPEGG